MIARTSAQPPRERSVSRLTLPVLARTCAVLAFASPIASAQDLRIDPGRCDSGVRVVARQVPVSELMQRLAQTLGFELRDDARSSRMIDADLTRAPADLLPKLVPNEAMIVSYTRDERCPQRSRIAKVWLLAAKGSQASAQTPSSAAPAAVANTGSASPPHMPTPAELDEQSRRAKAASDAYFREHGTPMPGVEDDAAK